jgi:hypothetical protein
MTRLVVPFALVFACTAPLAPELGPDHPASPQAAEAPEPARSRTLEAGAEPPPAPAAEASPHVHH